MISEQLLSDCISFLSKPSIPEGEGCKGIWFRGYNNTYYSDGKFEKREGIKLLKRKSCKGCEKCGFLLDDAIEQIRCDNLIFPKEIVDGGLYTIKVTNEYQDWETGYIDDWDTEIIKVEE